MAANAPQDPGETPPWWASLPEVQSSCPSIDASEVAELLKTTELPKGDAGADGSARHEFLLVDVRRTDWEGGTIATSINLPAHSFFQTRPIVYQLCKQAGVKTIIFYCGSSNGRGPRCAGWMQDYLNEVGDATIRAVILKGGIKGWQKAYGGKMMDWYDEKAWGAQDK